MEYYIDDPMDICPPSPSAKNAGTENHDLISRFSNRHEQGGPTCTSPICPIRFAHAPGKFLQNGKPPRAQDTTVFGGSNPPQYLWKAYERCSAGIGSESDIRIVQALREVHGNNEDPWTWAAEDQRWAQQLQKGGWEDQSVSDTTVWGNGDRGGHRGGPNRGSGPNKNRGHDHRGGNHGGGKDQSVSDTTVWGDRDRGGHRGGPNRGGGPNKNRGHDHRGGNYGGGKQQGGHYQGGNQEGGTQQGGHYQGVAHQGGNQRGGNQQGGDYQGGPHRGSGHRGGGFRCGRGGRGGRGGPPHEPSYRPTPDNKFPPLHHHPTREQQEREFWR